MIERVPESELIEVSQAAVGDVIEIMEGNYDDTDTTQETYTGTGRLYEVAPACPIIGQVTCFNLKYGRLKVRVSPCCMCRVIERSLTVSQNTTATANDAIYLVRDLIDPLVYDFPQDAYVETQGQYAYLVGVGAYRNRLYTADLTPVAIATALKGHLWKRKPALPTPTISAEKLGRKIRDRWPLTAAQLLMEPEFARLARAAAEKDKKFTTELLEWEKKDVVIEAVARVRLVVEAERKARAEEEARRQAEYQAQRNREQPTRSSVTEAYRSCKYRTCTQGHTMTVSIGQTTGVTSDVTNEGRYSSACTYQKKSSVHTIRVREDWLQRVAERGLETFDGQLVLDAVELGHTDDRSGIVLRLKVVRQGRGTSLETGSVEVVYDGFTCRKLTRLDAITVYSDERIAHDACIDAGLVAG